MRFCVLGSGSSGNCTFVETGATRLLIDAGFSAIETERRLAAIAIPPATISAILITHEHGDHVKGVSVFSRRYRIPVLATAGTFQAAGAALAQVYHHEVVTPGVACGRLDGGRIAGTSRDGAGATSHQELAIHPFAISHDAADPVGYVIRGSRKSLGYCTDTGVVSRLIRHRLAGLNALVLECNHDPELLRRSPYPPQIQQRIRSTTGHLANYDAIELLQELRHDGLAHVVLAHISEKSNSHDCIRQEVRQTMAASDDGPALVAGCRITLARQDEIGEVVCLGDS